MVPQYCMEGAKARQDKTGLNAAGGAGFPGRDSMKHEHNWQEIYIPNPDKTKFIDAQYRCAGCQGSSIFLVKTGRWLTYQEGIGTYESAEQPAVTVDPQNPRRYREAPIIYQTEVFHGVRFCRQYK
jgi:hypothetical protein